MVRAARTCVAAAACALMLAACTTRTPAASPPPPTPSTARQTGSTGGRQPPSGSTTSSTTPPAGGGHHRPPSKPVTIAFAGDVHFASYLAQRLDHPRTAVGPMAKVLARADLSIVNLETAVTTRGTPQPKQYVFRAPPVVFTALRDAGVDVATMANNHGLDYGPVSVPDALAAARKAAFPVIGIGRDAAQAYRPWFVTVHGQRIAFIGATAVLDADLVSSWSATATHPGLATAMDGNNARLVAAVKAAKSRADTVVVDLHYGSDLQTCPTDIQRKLASDLAKAGANVVVGQHAHVLLGAGYEGTTYVDYGLGNFQFYVSGDGPQAETGVLELTVDNGTVTRPHWVPGRIVSGLPTALTGSAARDARAHWNSLRTCAGLSTLPQ